MRTTFAIALGLLAGCGKSSTGDKAAGSAAPTTTTGTPATGSGAAPAPKPPIDQKPMPPLVADPGGATGKVSYASSFGGLGIDVPSGIAVGAGGESYLTGFVDGVAEFGAAGKYDAGAKADAYVVKLDADGKPTWVRGFGGERDAAGRGVAVQGDTVVAVGNFTDTMQVGKDAKTSLGNDDIFVVAFGTDGTPKWSVTGGGIDSDGANAIAATPDGGYIVGGSFIGSATLGDKTVKSHNNSQDALLLKLSATGTVEWMTAYGGDYYDTVQHVAVDGNGNIFVQGTFRDVANFGGDKLTAGGGADEDIVLAKYDANGTHLWSKRFGSEFDDVAGGIGVDPSGAVTMAGAFDKSISFGEGDQHTALGESDAFVARFDGTGKLEWVRTYGGERPDIAFGIAVDSSGNSVTTGWFEGTAEFGKGAVTTAGSKDVFVVKLSAKGDVMWSQTFGDHDHDQGRVVGMDSQGRAIVAGLYRFKLTISPTAIESVHAPADRIPKPDVFVVRFER